MSTPFLRDLVDAFAAARVQARPRLRVREMGTVLSVDEGIVFARGLPDVTSEEMVEFATGTLGYIVELLPDRVVIAMLDRDRAVRPGAMVWRTERVLDAPVGEALIERIVDPLGRPLDTGGPISTPFRRPIERPAPPITMLVEPTPILMPSRREMAMLSSHEKSTSMLRNRVTGTAALLNRCSIAMVIIKLSRNQLAT